ncbi:hypothetical protein KLP40_01485 [Hymenobacter sp. NST-14]|uniref:hypothetical protein n=1 Tax=Hymenobacter piscis TaxID=2839984 RepID=UPI001C03805F|nr:hypothetical protein [Hymenobacter piscis]MBT9391820.1 hypothetical protein [Hymenobacter piscis]
MKGLLMGVGLLSIGLLSEAQGQSVAARPVRETGRQWGFSVDLLPLLASGYHLSAERRLGTSSRQKVVLTPQFYRGPVSDLTSDRHEGDTDRVRGWGLAAQHRFYLGRQATPLTGSYLAYGVSYQHFDMQFRAVSWQSELAADGLYYYQSRLRNQTEAIDRYGASIVAGQQMEATGTPFFLDFFLGLGWRHATSRTTLPGRHFAATPRDYGKAGAYLPIGFRLGWHL